MVVLIVLLCLIIIIVPLVKYIPNRLNVDHCIELDSEATIVEIRSERDDWGRNKNIKTIVRFSDGSEYHTYYTTATPGFGYVKLSVDDKALTKIIAKAKAAHTKKMERWAKGKL